MKNSQAWHPAHIRAHRDLSPTVREFEIRPEGGVKPWTVGSHLKVQVMDGDTRSYSLVGLPDKEVYRIAVKRAEPGRGGSRFMWGLEAGAELMIGEPNNHFELAFNAPQFLLVAGGIGITPLVGMAQMLAARGADLRMRYAARSAAELVLADVLQQALGDRLQTFCSDAGQRLDLDAEIAGLAPRGQMLVCGPIGLLDAAREAWARAGRAAADLRFETFGNSGHHAVQPFWVELPRHKMRIEVPADRSLLDVLTEAGVETLSDCCRGECGLCAMDVIAVQGDIDHRDVFFSEHEHRANQRLCACVSRVSGGGVVLDTAYRAD
ncbi:MAG TPA: PDR/VanB family oxidoreductase [Rhizobacter sp.]|nr:PDR/VanB family oxidoreductase [Rhizobacter sp.]